MISSALKKLVKEEAREETSPFTSLGRLLSLDAMESRDFVLLDNESVLSTLLTVATEPDMHNAKELSVENYNDGKHMKISHELLKKAEQLLLFLT